MLKAAREIRANLEAAARLDGLNAPQRTEVEVSVTVGQSIEANRQRLLELVEAKAVRTAPALPAAQSSPALPVIDCEAVEVSA